MARTRSGAGKQGSTGKKNRSAERKAVDGKEQVTQSLSDSSAEQQTPPSPVEVEREEETPSVSDEDDAPPSSQTAATSSSDARILQSLVNDTSFGQQTPPPASQKEKTPEKTPEKTGSTTKEPVMKPYFQHVIERFLKKIIDSTIKVVDNNQSAGSSIERNLNAFMRSKLQEIEKEILAIESPDSIEVYKKQIQVIFNQAKQVVQQEADKNKIEKHNFDTLVKKIELILFGEENEVQNDKTMPSVLSLFDDKGSLYRFKDKNVNDFKGTNSAGTPLVELEQFIERVYITYFIEKVADIKFGADTNVIALKKNKIVEEGIQKWQAAKDDIKEADDKIQKLQDELATLKQEAETENNASQLREIQTSISTKNQALSAAQSLSKQLKHNYTSKVDTDAIEYVYRKDKEIQTGKPDASSSNNSSDFYTKTTTIFQVAKHQMFSLARSAHVAATGSLLPYLETFKNERSQANTDTSYHPATP